MDALMALLKTLPPWMLLSAGVFAGWFKSFWTTIYDHTAGYAVRKMHVSLTVEDTEHAAAYRWLSRWAEGRLREKRISALLLRRRQRDDAEYTTGYELVPDYGTYYVRWQKKYLMVLSHSKEKGNSDNGTPVVEGNGKLLHSFTVSIWGTLRRQVLLDVLTEAKMEYDLAHPETLYYYTHTGYGDGWEANLLTRREMDTIYLPGQQLDPILADFERFFESKEIYRKLGIPWRRGWLFYGPPGTGKSSLVRALSCRFDVPIHYLSLSAIFSAQSLIRLFMDVETPGIVLLEDADCLQVMQGRAAPAAKDKNMSSLGLHDVLNVLDGLVATEGRLVIMTTNHRDKLDNALLRAGRVDREFELDYAAETELERFCSFAGEFLELPDYGEFRRQLPPRCTIADAQALAFRLQMREAVPA